MLQKLAEKFLVQPDRGEASSGAVEQQRRFVNTPRGLEEGFLFYLSASISQRNGSQTAALDHLCGALSVQTRYEQLGTVLSGSPFCLEIPRPEEDWEETCILTPEKWAQVALLLKRLLEAYPNEPLLHLLRAKACVRSGARETVTGVECARMAISCCDSETPIWLKDQCHLTLAVSLSASASHTTLGLTERVECRQEAREILSKMVEDGQCGPIVLYNLALLHAEDRHYNQALRLARLCLSTAQGAFGPASALLALILSGRREHKSALKVIDHGLSQATDLFKCLLVLTKTNLLSALQTPAEGIVVLANYCSEISLDEGIPLDEDTRIKQVQVSKVWQELTCMYLAEDRVKDAEFCMIELDKVAPFSPDKLYVEGRVKQHQGKSSEAIEKYEMAMAMDPYHAPSSFALGELYRLESESCLANNSAELVLAHSLLSDGLRQQPDNHDGWANLGLVCKYQGMLEEAKKYQTSAVSLAASAPVMSFTQLPRFM